MSASSLTYRVGIMGCPVFPEAEWSHENLSRLKELGFNTMQINIAWGSRPGGEPLNLEDLYEVPEELAGHTPMIGDQTEERRARRHRELHERSALCHELGMRTIFHYGAPYIGDCYWSDAPPNCLLDDKTLQRCIHLLEQFGEEFPEVDDILIYTYDQHAWLCNEFGPCPRCTGKPLHERVVPFLERMGEVWRASHPQGRLWWEPWELSAGQVLMAASRIRTEGFGLSLHCNIAEVMAALPADRWIKNCAALASQRGIPVIGEYFLGAASEEVEPYMHLAHPLTVLRGLKDLARIPGLSGIKEYYGLLPFKEDANLRMTGLFFANPSIGEEEALALLAEPYGEAAKEIQRFWRLTSSAMELFPWDTSWLIREIGRSNPAHSLSAAALHGVPWHTPSWMSTRRAIFMKVDPLEEPDAWMLEDVQLRCQLAADQMREALSLAESIKAKIPDSLRDVFAKNLEELAGFHQRAMAYVYHIRETNIARSMRVLLEQGLDVPPALLREMEEVLEADMRNQTDSAPLETALQALRRDLRAFLEEYFTLVPDQVSKGYFTLTSR